MAITSPRHWSTVGHWSAAGLGIVGSALFGITVGLLAIAVCATQFLGYHVATIQSYSMEPALHRGDVIIVRPTNINDSQVGDVVLFEEGATVRLLVAHRVDGIFNITTNTTDSRTGDTKVAATKALRTKGDANERADPEYVDGERFKGTVWLTVPNVGLIANRFPLQRALILVTAILAVSWAVYEWRRFSAGHAATDRGK